MSASAQIRPPAENHQHWAGARSQLDCFPWDRRHPFHERVRAIVLDMRRRGDNLVVLQWSRGRVDRYRRSDETLAQHYHSYGMGEENGPIYSCRGLKQPLAEIWPRLKLWN